MTPESEVKSDLGPGGLRSVAADVVCTRGGLAVGLRREDGPHWQGWRASLGGDGHVKDLSFIVRRGSPLHEIFIAAPNNEDVRYAHPSQTVWLGYDDAGVRGRVATGDPYTMSGAHGRFGFQWMFTPPPFVFPLRAGARWGGVGIGAPPGRNVYSSVSYSPIDAASFMVVVSYGGASVDEMDGICLLSVEERFESPYEVIASYAEDLRRRGWAPTPQRQPAAWWYDTFVFPWGEQCNIASPMKREARKVTADHPVASYETEANQRRWVQRLVDREVPVGVACTSDKWQRDRYRLLPDPGRYEDLTEFVRWHHDAGRHVIAWWGLWLADGAPLEWCITDQEGKAVSVDPGHPGYREVLAGDITRLLGKDGYDIDGFFLDFTAAQPEGPGSVSAGGKGGIELLHDYVGLIYEASKAAKPDAMVMTHCPHPYFADVTDVLRLNDWAVKVPNVVEQARYRQQIASNCSDWLVNTDNWMMYDIGQWREYLEVQPELGIPASWFTHGVFGEGSLRYEPFTDDDYRRWKQIWATYRKDHGLG
ncbi:MAG TPA: hypothetical protein VL984_04495 [Acidimicrobiales bacterium]|nr:hypothetical protein [Acidimicrobiales bacterium]